MIVEGAERFGLAQLHQLRGRVGRGTDPSFCVLVSTAAEGTTEHERLKAVAATTDGFELAEKDFELRREGDVLGPRPERPAAAPGRDPEQPRAPRAGHPGPGLGGAAARRPRPARRLAGSSTASSRRGWLHRVHDGDPASAA